MQALDRHHTQMKLRGYLKELEIDTDKPRWLAEAIEATGYSRSHLGNVNAGRKIMGRMMEEHLQQLVNNFKRPDVIPELSPDKPPKEITKIPQGVSGKPAKLKQSEHKRPIRPTQLSDKPSDQPHYQEPAPTTARLTPLEAPVSLETASCLAVVCRALSVVSVIRDEISTGARWYLQSPDGSLKPYAFDLTDGEKQPG